MQTNNLKKEALEYHARERRGKVEVVPTKPYSTQRDLSLAYSPGVAEPCKAIADNPQDVYKYTAKGNLVAVISNGTAVLGLGDIGPEASKPVMEGKGVRGFSCWTDVWTLKWTPMWTSLWPRSKPLHRRLEESTLRTSRRLRRSKLSVV